ncbi:MAG: ATP-dependent metallopeptidase FtsH/Yme1/Tma family protein, partial [Acidobacteria bacterium]|nr:ATP-dependent metallopeptidase FtsH/Yme1/Tma family protein [Acidobacteriota bacterium]
MAVTALLIWAVVRSSTGEHVNDYTFTQFVNQVEGGNVEEVTIAGSNVTGVLKKDSSKFKTTIPGNYPDLYKDLLSKNVRVTIKDESNGSWVSWLANGLPLLLLVGLWIFFMRQMQSGGNKALSFGKSRARLLSTQHKKVTFKDVAGVTEAKEELQEIIEFLREPQKFQKLGG